MMRKINWVCFKQVNVVERYGVSAENIPESDSRCGFLAGLF